MQGVVAPFAVTLAVIALARLATGGGLRTWLSGASIALGLLAAYFVIFDWPQWPPRAAQQKIAVLVAVSLAVGLLFDVARAGPTTRGFVAIAAIPAAALWLVLSLFRPALSLDLALGSGAIVAAFIVAWRCGAMLDDAQAAGATLAVAALGLSLIAVLGRTASISQLALALAAAAAYTLWNWLGGRDTFGVAAALGGYGALALLIAQAIAFIPSVSVLALVVLGGSLFAGRVVRSGLPRLSPQSYFFAIAVAFVAAVPAAAAVAVVLVASGARGPY